MSILASIQKLNKHVGSQTLFSNISLGLFEYDKIGLIGPNGTGKTTLMKILAGLDTADGGDVVKRSGLKVSYLAQSDEFDPKFTIGEAMIANLKAHTTFDENESSIRISQALSQLGFEDDSIRVSTLSGGWRKRLALATKFAEGPDLLLLDEPTNHLDLDGIVWLENHLKRASFAFVVITHDRYFLENVTRQIVELSPRFEGGFFKVNGVYSEFVEKRETYLAELEKREVVLSNIVRREVEWLRRGPKARTTKAKSRIKGAHELQDNLQQLKQLNRADKKVHIDFEATEVSGRELLKVHQLTKSIANKLLVNKLNFRFKAGMKIGLVGPNGVGKSTLMKLLHAELKPDEGSVKTVEGVRIAYFDQHREQIPKKSTLQEALTLSGSDTVIYRDRPLHIITWAKKFLFKPEQLGSDVSTLSGGERSRVQLARMMQQPADILLLDEPTNDLDIPSLEILEQALHEFDGAIVLVTHDRYLMDRVCNGVLGFEGEGVIQPYADLSQYVEAREEKLRLSQPVPTSSVSGKNNALSSDKKSSGKLSYKFQYELDSMDENIQKAEAVVQKIAAELEKPEFQSDANKMTELCDALNEAQANVDALYARWGELEGMKG